MIRYLSTENTHEKLRKIPLIKLAKILLYASIYPYKNIGNSILKIKNITSKKVVLYHILKNQSLIYQPINNYMHIISKTLK